ncbi:MAG TPA: hypothetical protein VF630_17345, partial [Hymenobacter sp.]
PSQPEGAAGTSLRQRDALLSGLAGGTFTAAPERAEQVRAFQFKDELVDSFLKSGVATTGQAALVLLPPPSLTTDEGAMLRFGQAYTAFLTQEVVGDTPETQLTTVVGFKKPQYVRPVLPLESLKEDVAAGTAPGPVFQVRIKQAAPTIVVPPAPVLTGDFEGEDFNATDFFVGNFDEPTSALTGDFRTLDFTTADFTVTTPNEPARIAEEMVTGAPAADEFVFARQTMATGESATGKEMAPFAVSYLEPLALTSVTAGAVATATPTDAALPVIKQAKVSPVFKDAMGEALRQRHPELFVPGLGEFPAGGVAVLEVNQAFIEAYMVGLNHALGSELLWRGFPVDVRGTFFQQFWDVSEHVNMQFSPTPPITQAPLEAAAAAALAEAALLDIKPLDQWASSALGGNAPSPEPTTLLRLALRSELLRRYPTLVLALQLKTEPTADPAQMLYPRQRLAVGQDLAVVRFDLSAGTTTADYYLMLMERPGQPKFGLDEKAPITDSEQTPIAHPLSWNDFSWEYLGTEPGAGLVISPTGKPHARTEPASVAYLTDSATVAYALFQAPVLASLDLSQVLD